MRSRKLGKKSPQKKDRRRKEIALHKHVDEQVKVGGIPVTICSIGDGHIMVSIDGREPEQVKEGSKIAVGKVHATKEEQEEHGHFLWLSHIGAGGEVHLRAEVPRDSWVDKCNHGKPGSRTQQCRRRQKRQPLLAQQPVREEQDEEEAIAS